MSVSRLKAILIFAKTTVCSSCEEIKFEIRHSDGFVDPLLNKQFPTLISNNFQILVYFSTN